MDTLNTVNHPADKNLDFLFDGSVSKTVLCNYLSRSMILEGIIILNGEEQDNYLRMIYHTGAKYIGRSACSWDPGMHEEKIFENMRQTINKAHKADPDIVFEACVFECVSLKVNEIPMPSWVFEAFHKQPEERCFRYEDMIFKDGNGVNVWGKNTSVPDMTNEETQMFFYYRGCAFISLGFEAIHMGQVHWIGENDTGWVCWTKILNMIRGYAGKYARRHFVFINAHTHGILDANGKLMFDFHAWPIRGSLPDGSVDHLTAEENPQKMELKVGDGDAIFTKSLGGSTYSGWSCDSMPYFVEFDNYTSVNPEFKDKAVKWWGYDEITWFANQPKSYRAKWLRYAYNWVNHIDPCGFLEMPGRRSAAIFNGNTIIRYYYSASSTAYSADGLDDEETIRNIWNAGREPDQKA